MTLSEILAGPAGAILAAAGDHLYIYDADGRFLFASPTGARLMGVAPEAMTGKTGQQLGFPAELMAQLDADRAHVLATGEVVRREVPVATIEGPRMYEYALTPLRLHDLERAVLSVVRDVTERVRLAQAVADEHALLATITDHISEGLFLLDSGGEVRYSNGWLERVWGLPRGGLIGKSGGELLGALRPLLVDPVGVVAAWRQAAARLLERPTLDLTLVGAPERDLQMQLFPCRTGEELLTGVLIRDLTPERELARAKDELVSMVSHELRTPLASVVGFTELLLVRVLDETERKEFLEIMLQEGRRLTALINDFLDVQRLESVRQTVKPVLTSVAALVERALETSGPDPERPIGVTLPPDLPAVLADTDAVHQVLLNLLSNARKYSPGGGAIHVCARRQGAFVELAVADQGLGIPPEALPRLFEKFYRVDSWDRREIIGTGLGLVIARKLVQEHGGEMRAESAGLGQGSTFRFTLPIADPSADEGDILIIEDDDVFARLVESELTQRGLSVVRVSSAELGWEHLEGARPRVLVLDLMLPGVQGEALLGAVRRREGNGLPVVVVTVKDLSPAQEAALRALGVVSILRKGPSVVSAVADAVRAALADTA